jgi:phospholipid/cholesterol/gamma-HCH transport system substrate-binding protein
MSDQSFKFRLGVFVIGSAILLAVLIILFGEVPAFFGNKVYYTVTFNRAPGLDEGVPVRKSGVKIGEVVSYDLDKNTGVVSVKVMIDKRYQPLVSDEVVLTRDLVLGATSINFVPKKNGDTTPAPEHHVFAGKDPTDLTQAFGTAKELAALAGKTLDEAKDAMTKLGTAAETLTNLMREVNEGQRIVKTLERINTLVARGADLLSPENQENLKVLLKQLRTASENFEGLMKRADTLLADASKAVSTMAARVDSVGMKAEAMIGDIQKVVDQVSKQIASTGKNIDELIKEAHAAAKRLSTTLARADEVLVTIQEVAKVVAERLPNTLKHIEEGAIRFNQAIAQVGSLTKMLTEGEGSLRKFLSDPALYNNLNDAAAAINRAMPRIDMILKDIQVFADKIARHPELLGIGGAINPSQGIKRP